MTVAPTIPTATVSAPPSAISGVTLCFRTRCPVDRGDDQLRDIGQAYHPNKRSYRDLKRTESARLHQQKAIGEDCRDCHAGEHRDVEQQTEPDRSSEKLGEISCHCGKLTDHPHDNDNGAAQMATTDLSEALACNEAEFGGQKLE
jgi:hypothetical protein